MGKYAGKRMALTMPHALYELLQQRAKQERRTVSNLAVALLADAMAYKDEDEKPDSAEDE